MRPLFDYTLPSNLHVTALNKFRPWDLPGAIVRLRRTMRSRRPDVVLGNMLYTNWVIGAAMARWDAHPAWVARLAATPSKELGPLMSFLFKPLLGRILSAADLHVANSVELASDVREFLNTPRDRLRVILTPIDCELIDRLAAEPGGIDGTAAPVVLWVGRLTKQKRPDLILDAFALVLQRCAAELWMCGVGSLEGRAKRRARRLGLEGRVRFLGFQSNPFRLMRRATVFVLSSDFEGMPQSLIEAQVLGIPAVSTRCPAGPAEIIDDGETGLLTPVGSAAAMASAIEVLLKDSRRRRQMGVAAAKRARSLFDCDRNVREWQRALEYALGSRVQCAE
jgi:glycosyltransferase involved in cell wall biosynthesis